MTGLLLWNLAPAIFLAGVAWYLQVVQLPLLSDAADFPHYIREHRLRNTALMALPMAAELIAAIALCIEWSSVLASSLLALLAAIWLATFLGVIPAFRRLARRYDRMELNRLIAWNGVRTACWTARSGALLYIVAKGFRI